MRKILGKLTLRKTLATLLAGMGLWLLILGAQVYAFSQLQAEGPADAAVVLGAAVYNNRPSPVFRERINHAITLYKQGQVEAIIFTGGFGERDNLAESEAARNYAIDNGIPAQDIYIETVSTTTYTNLAEAQKIAVAQGFETLLIVSDPMHMRRAMSLAEELGLNADPAPTPTSRYRSTVAQGIFLLRETYFYAIYLLSSLVF